jgi:hypothetical protein
MWCNQFFNKKLKTFFINYNHYKKQMKTRLVKTVKINLQYVNHRICKEVCEDTINILTDQNFIF